MSDPILVRQQLSTDLFAAALVMTSRAVEPPLPRGSEFAAQESRNYAQAALALTQAWITLNRPTDGRRG